MGPVAVYIHVTGIHVGGRMGPVAVYIHVTGIHVGGRMGPVAVYKHVTWTAGASEGVLHAGVPYTTGTN